MIAPPRPPSHDELEALIREARERQRRRRLRVAAVIATAAALGLGIHALTMRAEKPAGTTVPRRSAGAPICKSDQLGSSAGFQGATQSMLGDITLQNTSATACSLPASRPRVSITWRGKRLQTEQRPMPIGPQGPLARVLAPGGKADLYFQWYSCGGPGPRAAVRPTFALRFRHGLLVTARSLDVTPPFCGGLGGRRTLGVSPVVADR